MKIYGPIAILLSLSTLANADSFMELSTAIPQLNSELLHQNIQGEVNSNSFSDTSMLLLKENAKLEDMIVDANQMNIGKDRDCNKLDLLQNTDPNKDKKKKETKVIKHGWRIVGSVEVNLQNQNDSYLRMENSLPDSQYDSMYGEIEGITNRDELKEVLTRHTQNMSDDDYMNYLSEMTSRLPYNSLKAGFDQTQQGTDSIYSMIQSNDIGGICGDIHFATVLMGEATRADNYEFYTASYVMGSAQHVYSFAVNKNNPSQAYVINYGRADKVENMNGMDSVLIQGQGGFDNIGANVRIYKNTGSGQDGTAEHVATMPTPIGRYLNNIHLEDNQQNEILNQNQGTVSEINFENSKTKIKTKGDKTKIIDIAQGVKLAHGNINNPNAKNSDIFTLMVYSKRKKNLDSFGNIINPKQIASESNFSLSGSMINQASSSDRYIDKKLYFVRLNYFNRYHKTLVRTENFDLQASGGFNINADFVSGNNKFSGDGNFQTELGLNSKVKLDNMNSLSIGGKVTHAIGLKEEREVFDVAKYPSNIKMTANVFNIKAKWDRKVGRNTASLQTDYTKSQVGGLKRASVGYQINTQNLGPQHIINVSYSLPDKGVNLLQTREQLGLGYGIKTNNFEAGGAINYSLETNDTFIGAKMKFNIGNKKKKKKAIDF
jgi:hypothetical protein